MITWVNLEGIMLNEISQTHEDKYCIIPLLCGIKKKKSDLQKQSRMVAARDWVWRGWRDIGQRVQAFSYKMTKFWEFNVHYGDCS